MVESLRELNKICQKPNYKTVGNWYVRHVVRDAALPVTKILLQTSVTANQVTLFSIFIGVFGVFLYGFPSAAAFFGGSLMLQLWYLLDHVDGQIARYHKTASLSGRFYDFIMHHFIHGLLPFGLGVYVAKISDINLFFYWGFLASVAIMMFNLVHDTKYKTYFEAMDKAAEIKFRENREGKEANASQVKDVSLPRQIFSYLHKSAEIHVMMNILTVLSLIGLVMPMEWVRVIIFLYYGCVMPILAISKIYYLIKNQSIDKEYHERFESK